MTCRRKRTASRIKLLTLYRIQFIHQLNFCGMNLKTISTQEAHKTEHHATNKSYKQRSSPAFSHNFYNPNLALILSLLSPCLAPLISHYHGFSQAFPAKKRLLWILPQKQIHKIFKGQLAGTRGFSSFPSRIPNPHSTEAYAQISVPTTGQKTTFPPKLELTRIYSKIPESRRVYSFHSPTNAKKTFSA
jgi:hypothetical protein